MPDDVHYLRLAAKLAAESRARGDHPFGALLIGPDGAVLISSGNTVSVDGGVGHAESNVAREAARLYGPEFLAGCALVTTVEPCCMCAGAAYWAGIGTVIYGMSERRLGELTGDNPENLTLDLDCRRVFATGRRPVAVRGPCPDLEAELLRDHAGFW